MRAYYSLTLVVMILFVCTSRSAYAQITGSNRLHASSVADLTYLGTNYHQGQTIEHSLYASSQALAGLTTTPEARTAARVSSAAIACNSRLDDKFFFSFIHDAESASTAAYGVTLTKLGGAPERVLAHFLLPPSFVEIVSYNEVPDARIDAGMSAVINNLPTDFEFRARITGSFQSESHNFYAAGQPGLDVSPLLNPTFTDTIMGDFRTTRLEFPSFVGTLDLGILFAGQSLVFDYRLDTFVDITVPDGALVGHVGIASINDPFFFDGDPVTPGIPVIFEFVSASVPEPSTLALMGITGMAFCAWAVRRRFNAKGALP